MKKRLVDVESLKTTNMFNLKQIKTAMDRINSGGTVDPGRLVRMLWQAYNETMNYENLVSLIRMKTDRALAELLQIAEHERDYLESNPKRFSYKD